MTTLPQITPRPLAVQTSDPLTNDASIKNSTVMIVDDEPINIKVVQKYLKSAGFYNFVSVDDSTKALGMIIGERPDILLLDVMMPVVTGLDILEALRSETGLHDIPVLILSAASEREIKLRALELGCTDFLAKPVDPSELTVRVRNALIVKAHQRNLADYSLQLEHKVRIRTAELAESRQQIIHILACAAEHRDHDTGNHVIRVGLFAAALAEQLGWPKEKVELIEQAAVLHDVGKIGISDSILLKPGKLDADEIKAMQQHCEFGMNILRGVPCQETKGLSGRFRSNSSGDSSVLGMAASIAISHHEKWDGSGYPLGLVGEQIPMEGRITAVADVFDALGSKRAYKEAMPFKKCSELLREGSGSHFDPRVVDAFLMRSQQILEIQRIYADN